MAVKKKGSNINNYVGLSTDTKALTDENVPLRTGEIGVVNTKYSYGDVRRYGAVGDGITDDHDAINNALTQNDIVYFEHDKIYKCNDGFYMNDGQIIKGNGATLLIDTDFAPKNDKIYGFIRYKYGATSGKYQIDDLTIGFNSTFQPNPDVAFVIFYPAGFDTVIFNNVTIRTGGQQSIAHLVWACAGTNIFNNVNLINNNQGIGGGCLWLNNKAINHASVICTNCYIYNTCSDELIGLFGTGSFRALFKGCKIEGTNGKLLKDTLLISVFDDSANTYSGSSEHVNVKFDTCEIICDYDSSSKYHNVCLIGVGSSNFNKRAIVELDNCSIINNSPNPVFSQRCVLSDLSAYDYPYNTFVNLNNCNIHTQGSVSGSYTIWKLNNALGAVPGLSMNAKGCVINCLYAVYDIPNGQKSSIKSTIEDCYINITSAEAILKEYYNSPVILNFDKNIVVADAVINIVKTTNASTNATIPKHSVQLISNRDNILNNAQLADSTQFTALN